MNEELFWMGGRLATRAIEISHDPSALEKDGFWAVQVDYEGRWTLIRFADVVESDFPPSQLSINSTEWNSTLDQAGYVDYVARMRESIARGDIYQVNACRILSKNFSGNLMGIFSNILMNNPAPYAAYFRSDSVEIASASPELFLSLKTSGRGIELKSSPIKGTSTTAEFGDKDQSENVMIVDLIRNDLSRICLEGTVDVTRLLGVEEHPGLFHLVSDVVGVKREDASWNDVAASLLPAGSISGAPKSSARKLIAENEGVRGPYCGLLGWIEKNGDEVSGELSVAIRIFWREKEKILFGTGAGITWGSDPENEWEETELKARRLFSIVDGRFSQ